MIVQPSIDSNFQIYFHIGIDKFDKRAKTLMIRKSTKEHYLKNPSENTPASVFSFIKAIDKQYPGAAFQFYITKYSEILVKPSHIALWEFLESREVKFYPNGTLSRGNAKLIPHHANPLTYLAKDRFEIAEALNMVEKTGYKNAVGKYLEHSTGTIVRDTYIYCKPGQHCKICPYKEMLLNCMTEQFFGIKQWLELNNGKRPPWI